MRSYRPNIGDRLTINGTDYEFARLQGSADFAVDLVHAQEGRKGIVYRILSSNGQSHALKIFFPEFRTARILKSSSQLANYRYVPGLTVCDRTVIESEEECQQLERYPELRYAVLMPWISGRTWFDVVVSQYEGKPITFTRSQSYDLALATSAVLADIEKRGLAHCDIANGNVIFDRPRRVIELIDVEDMYGPGFTKPKRLPAGSKGYAHPMVHDGEWSPTADRFAGAVLLGEFLCWHLPEVRQLVNDDTYFTGDDIGQKCPRYFAMYENLAAAYSPAVAEMFKEAWFSTRLPNCPTLGEWAEGLAAVEDRTVPILEVTPDALNFGTIAQGPVSRDLRLANAGKSTLKGKIRVVDGPWLSVAANTFSLAAGAKGKIEVQANPLPDQTGETISFGNLSIKSNGGDTEILAEARHLAPVKKKGRKLRILAATTMYLAVLFFLFLLTVFGYDMYLMTFPASLIVTGGYFYWLVRGRRSAKQKYVAPPKVTKQKSTYKSSEPIKVVIPKQKSSKTRSNKLKTDVLVIGATGRRAKKTGKEIKNRGFRVETGDINVSVTSIVIGKPSLILFGPMKLDRGNIKQYQRLVKRAAGTKLVLATRDSNASDKIIRANLLAYDYIIGDEVEKLGNWVNKFLARRYYQPQGGLTRQVGSLVLDANSRHATLSSKQIVLTDIEFDILLTLVDRLDFVNYKTIGRQVWGVTTGRKAATDIFVERLRRKLAAGNVRIVNVENQGYLIVAEG